MFREDDWGRSARQDPPASAARPANIFGLGSGRAAEYRGNRRHASQSTGDWGATSPPSPLAYTLRYARRTASSASRSAIVPANRIAPFSMM